MKIRLTYKGMDSWNRPVYEDDNGVLWKDVDPRKHIPADLCSSCNNQFNGEPNTNMCYMEKYKDAEIEFVPERITA